MSCVGGESLSRGLGPKRIGLWFDERKGYRANNERFWHIRRTLIHSDLWRAYRYPSIPVVPEWFGMLLPFERAWRETGMPVIWAMMLGFPDLGLRDRALNLIEAQRPPGLLRIEKRPEDPSAYHLPLVGFHARRVFLTLEPEHPRRYDPWEGYETLGIASETDESAFLDLLGQEEGERVLLRQLALNLGRWIDAPDRTAFEEVVDHARELWALGAVGAAGAVAGTAMERLLAASLIPTRAEWLKAERPALGPLIDAVGKDHGLPASQRAALHAFRELRNECAHAVGEEVEGDAESDLSRRVDEWLGWLEQQAATPGDPPGPFESRPERPPPEDLHRRASDAGRDAAAAVTPVPMKVMSSDGSGSIVEEGVIGDAAIVIRTRRDALARWLLEHGDGDAGPGGVRLHVSWPTQSMTRAVAYAQAYVDVIREFGVEAHYESRLD